MFALGWLIYKVAVEPIRTAPMASTVLLTFGLALVLEGPMGVIWGNNSTSIRPAYVDESFSVGDFSCRRRRCTASWSPSWCSARWR